jgi:tetratricopeptide (TPR) repeat protein
MANDPSPLEQAAEEYARHLREHPEDAQVLLLLADVRQKLGREREAAEVYVLLSQLMERRGSLSGAIAMLRQAHRLVQGDVVVCRALVGLLRRADQPSEAVEVLEATARVAAGRGEGETRRLLLEEQLALDPSGSAAALALADVLVQEGRPEEAAARLREVLTRLDEERRVKERLQVLERLQLLVPEDLEVVTAAALLALKRGEPLRMLGLLRRALDARPEAPELYALAARGLRSLGDDARALLVHREAARTFMETGRREQARAEWRTVLEEDPEDTEARLALLALEDAGEERPARAPEEPRRARPSPPLPAEPYMLDVSAEELDGRAFVLVRDPHPTSGEPGGTGLGRVVHEDPVGEAVFILPKAWELDVELDAPARQGGRPPPVEPLPRRALVLGTGPEAGWIRRALEEGGVECARVERPEDLVPPVKEDELAVVPAALAEDVRARGPWRVLSIPTLGRGGPSQPPRARGLPVVEAGHGPEERVHVVVASDGRHAFGLAEWREARLETRAMVESPAGEGEEERLALAGRAVEALGLLGVTVVVLARERGTWRFESLEGSSGPGVLTVEARTELSLPRLALGLLRGERLEAAPPRRGHALAAVLSRPLGHEELANLRLEPAEQGGSAFVCAYAPQREPAARRLARALKVAGVP